MDIYVLNENFETVGILDHYESLIWTDRYYGYGDFEIYTNFTSSILAMMQHDRYLHMADSEHMMIVESVEVASDAELGERLIISGRSLESILTRRIIWNTISVTGSLQTGLAGIINDNFINPTDSKRQIANFIFEPSTDPRITALTWEQQMTGDNVYDVVNALCEENQMGFKVTLNDLNQFVMTLYMGENRSYDQDPEVNPYVVFSPSYENIINSNYLDNTTEMKNVALVAGEDSGSARRTITIGATEGLPRRELYVDARDIQSEQVTQYEEALKERGLQYLDENKRVISFEGQVEATKMFRYGVDFFMGDIIQISNEYGIQGAARVVEFIHNEDATGKQTYPTFEAIQENDYDIIT